METKTINRQEVKVAEMAVQKEREERRAEEMQAHQAELHKPKMPKGRCGTCDANRVDYVKEKMPELAIAEVYEIYKIHDKR